MKAQILNRCQGPHYLQLQVEKGRAPEMLVIHPGLNLVDAKKIETARKGNKSIDALFSAKVKASKAQEARDNVHNFGKPMLEVIGKPLPDRGALVEMPLTDACALIELTSNTDQLVEWQSDCDPSKHQELLRAISDRMKTVASFVQGAQK